MSELSIEITTRNSKTLEEKYHTLDPWMGQTHGRIQNV
jgi:hypothetical protein